MIEVPTTEAFADYRQATVLGDRLFRLRFVYNARQDSWHMDVLDASGALIRSGLRLRTDWSCLAQHVEPRLPDGILSPMRLDGGRAEPGRRDFDKLAALTFAARSELPAPS